MSHRCVETIIGRLATDTVLRRRFANDPQSILTEFHARGELTSIECDALMSLDAIAVETFAHSLDRRIQKVTLG